MAYSQQEDGPAKPTTKQESDASVLEEAQRYLKECVDEESTERTKMQDDLRFCTLDQWPEDIRKKREGDRENGPRPCLTIDKINQYIVQVVNDVRQGRPGIVVRPQDSAADIETAKILKGLIRNIEDQSSADVAYGVAVENAAKIGLGYFRITTEYVSDDSFDQELFIRSVPNTFSVYLGKHIMPDGSDAEHGFVVESMPVEKFKTEFPKAKWQADDFDGLDKEALGYWRTAEMVTVVEYFCIKREMHQLLFLADGTTMSGADYAMWPEEAGAKPSVKDRRTSFKRQLKWYKMTGVEVLEKRDLPGKYIPIVEVIGREAHVSGRRVLWGLVRPAKDSLRLYNYWASTITEKMALAPKTPYIGAKGQFAGMEEKWKKANTENYAYLEYDPIDVNGNALPRPERQGPTPMEAALLKQMEVIEHDVQTSLGMFKAATGESESQQSGRAILALQRESDTGTYHFGANLGQSIRHAGRILVDLIPHYYDTKRIVRILGEDGEVQTAQIDPEQEVARREIRGNDGKIRNIYNPGVGKYDVTITVGPSYNTKRMEAAATFVELAKGSADPARAAVLSYLTVLNSDFSGAQEAARMLKALIPPQALPPEEGQAPIPPQAQAEMMQMRQALQMASDKVNELQSGAQQHQMKVSADHDARMKELALEEKVEAERARLAREKAQAEVSLKQWMSGQQAAMDERHAEHERTMAQQKMDFERECRMKDDMAKRAEKEESEAQSMAPQMMHSMEALVQGFAAMLQQQNQFNAALIERLDAREPRAIDLAGIKRDSKGHIIGARATVQ